MTASSCETFCHIRCSHGRCLPRDRKGKSDATSYGFRI
jgi:hypothetical protein